MGLRYLPMTETDKAEMLEAIGIKSTDELFSDIPASIRLNKELQLKKSTSEYELMRELTELSQKNMHTAAYSSFLGAGVYDHFIPSVVDHVISRSEFYTAYTPYQPEISQGELQAIFEFQTMICELTGMEIANSSMYDGGTALAEAVTLSAGYTKRKKILVSKTIHPESREVIQSYGRGQNLDIIEIDHQDGMTDLDHLRRELDADTASVVIQYPNFFGQIEPLEAIEKIIAQEKKAMFLVSSNPLSLGYLTPPGEFGADIVVGDTQVFGIPAQFGGPHCGYFAVTKPLMRKVPGRLVGQTVDEEGVRGFVLTLQAREQHIRRDKATSNICSNQALNALASSVAMTSIGKQGMKHIAMLNMQKTHYAKQLLAEVQLPIIFTGPFFNEIVVKLKFPVKEVNKQLQKKGMIGGYDLGKTYASLHNHMLIAVTEIRSKEEIERFVQELGDING